MEQREVIILGGGLMALAIGLELQLRGAAVTVLGADFAAAAGHAAAGMLAPQAEGLLPGPMQDLCLRSRSAYADWAEQLARRTGKSVGYWPSGIMAPAYAAADFNHPATDWRSLIDLRQIQPGLSDAVQGGWYFPQDAQVDNVQLMQALWQAARDAGVELRDRVKIAAIVTASPSRDRAVQHLQTDCGQWQADHYVLATGAWSQSLLPIPVKPIKGQMLSLQWPDRGDAPLPLQCVLFGSHIYVVPRQDGRIVLGATSEDVGFAPDNTAAGVHQLLHEALRLFPALAAAKLRNTWWGYRPATPDELPILGASPYRNLTLATGHYRNGVLLAPITAHLIADWVWSQRADDLLPAFSWQRFGIEPNLAPAEAVLL